jgi:hypothetical protein
LFSDIACLRIPYQPCIVQEAGNIRKQLWLRIPKGITSRILIVGVQINVCNS